MSKNDYIYQPPKRRPTRDEAFSRGCPVLFDARGGFYSDRFVMVRGEPPKGRTIQTHDMRKTRRIASRNLLPVRAIGEVATETDCVVFRVGRMRKPERALMFVNKWKLDYVAHPYPGAALWASGATGPLVLKVGRRVVGLVMPILPAPGLLGLGAALMNGKAVPDA